MTIPLAITFDDVNLVPRYSTIESRKMVSTMTSLTKRFKIPVPIIGAPMDSVCEESMMKELGRLGAVGTLHRFMSIEDQVSKIISTVEYLSTCSPATYRELPICAAIGANGDAVERATKLIAVGVNVILIDVAHGHHQNVARTLELLLSLRSKLNWNVDFIAGNIATPKAAQDLESWGADALRVGIGGGSVCETRIRTGVGIPQLTTVQQIASVTKLPIISDGGIRYPGDIAKALAAGASTVMIGSLLSGTDEAPGDIFIAGQWPNNKKYKAYRGSASASIKMEKTGLTQHVEGASKMVECKGPVKNVIGDLMDGVTSAMSYLGASTIAELWASAEFVRISSAGLREAHPHLL